MTKVCSKCGVGKNETEFAKRKKSADGRSSICKECKKEYDRAYRQHPIAKKKRNAGKIRWRQTEKCKEGQHRHYEENKESRLADSKQWALDHPDEVKESRRRWAVKDRIENPDRVKNYAVQKREEDVQYRIKDALRARLNVALKRGFKAGSAVGDLGCSIPELRVHLERKFPPGMTWENWGKGFGKWNIDHIMPLAAFDLTDRQHVLLACSYLNLQPLWFEDNMAKGDKIGGNIRRSDN
jgi:hypothetical protein